MNNQQAENTLGEESWYFRGETEIKIDDLNFVFESYTNKNLSYNSNMVEWACERFLEMVENKEIELEKILETATYLSKIMSNDLEVKNDLKCLILLEYCLKLVLQNLESISNDKLLYFYEHSLVLPKIQRVISERSETSETLV